MTNIGSVTGGSRVHAGTSCGAGTPTTASGGGSSTMTTMPAAATGSLQQALQGLTESLAQLQALVALRGAAPAPVPSAPVPGLTAGANGAPTAATAAGAPRKTGAPAINATPKSGSSVAGVKDGPGVTRKVISKAALEREYPKLKGKLDPPKGSKPPKGVKVHTREDGARVVTLNIHRGTPSKTDLKLGNENIDGLRDIAAYINGIDADVISVQEIRNTKSNKSGVPRQASVLAHLIGATDMVHGKTKKGDDVGGNATFTRNGYKIGQTINAKLAGPEARASLVSTITPPAATGVKPFTMLSGHLSHKQTAERDRVRTKQLGGLQRMASAVAEGKPFQYTPVTGGKPLRASGFASGRVVAAGDYNTVRDGGPTGSDKPDAILGKAGLRHAQALDRSADASRIGGTLGDRFIDHVYARGFGVSDSWIRGVRNDELDDKHGTPTDHKGYIVDMR